MFSWRIGHIHVILLIALVILSLGVAGCTSPPSPFQPVTTLPVSVSTVPVVSPSISDIPSQEMVGNWILASMATGEDSPLITPTTAINLTIGDDGTLTGNGGCNSYSGPYLVQGTTTLYGRSITIGPVLSTQMYCRATSEPEGTYFQILQSTASYSINNGNLILRTNGNTYLIFRPVS